MGIQGGGVGGVGCKHQCFLNSLELTPSIIYFNCPICYCSAINTSFFSMVKNFNMPYAKGRVVTARTCINKKGHGFTGKIQMVVIDLQKQPYQRCRLTLQRQHAHGHDRSRPPWRPARRQVDVFVRRPEHS